MVTLDEARLKIEKWWSYNSSLRHDLCCKALYSIPAPAHQLKLAGAESHFSVSIGIALIEDEKFDFSISDIR